MGKEIDILKAFLPALKRTNTVPIGPGDDCAAIDLGDGKLLLAAVDQLIGDVHYFRDNTLPAIAGAKLLKRNLSDIAAMGGIPRWALLTIADSDRTKEWVVDFCQGVAECANKYEVNLCGGDTASLPANSNTEVATLTILGVVNASDVITRSGAKVGDEVYVTGQLGNSLKSQHHLNFLPRLKEGQFLANNHLVSAMMDISDGLLLDAQRLAESSNVAIKLDLSSLPLRDGANTLMALTNGEDYELLFTVSPALKLEDKYPKDLTPIKKIGYVIAPTSGNIIYDTQGNNLQEKERGGYEH